MPNLFVLFWIVRPFIILGIVRHDRAALWRACFSVYNPHTCASSSNKWVYIYTNTHSNSRWVYNVLCTIRRERGSRCGRLYINSWRRPRALICQHGWYTQPNSAMGNTASSDLESRIRRERRCTHISSDESPGCSLLFIFPPSLRFISSSCCLFSCEQCSLTYANNNRWIGRIINSNVHTCTDNEESETEIETLEIREKKEKQPPEKNINNPSSWKRIRTRAYHRRPSAYNAH